MAQEPPLDVGPVNAASVRTAQLVDSETGTGYDTSVLGDIGSGGTGGSSGPAYDGQVANSYLPENDGDLALAVQQALSDLPGNQGTVYVYPRDDGNAHTWGTDIALDLVTWNGAEIRIGYDVRIDYPNNGTAITLDNTGNFGGSHPGSDSKLRLYGGYWDATGSDPECWLRIKDSIGCHIQPGSVKDFTNSNGDAVGVSVENHQSYSESTNISGHYDRVDRGIDFLPQSVTGGSGGTDSFHDCYLENVHINAYDYCLRLRGLWDYGTIIKPALFGKADGCSCLVIDTERADGTVVTGMKCESPGNFDVTAIDYRGDPFYGLATFGGRIDGFGISTKCDTSQASFDYYPQIRMRENAIEFLNWKGGDMRFHKNGGLSVPGGIDLGGNLSLGGYRMSVDSPNVFFRNGNGNGWTYDDRTPEFTVDGLYRFTKNGTTYEIDVDSNDNLTVSAV